MTINTAAAAKRWPASGPACRHSRCWAPCEQETGELEGDLRDGQALGAEAQTHGNRLQTIEPASQKKTVFSVQAAPRSHVLLTCSGHPEKPRAWEQ